MTSDISKADHAYDLLERMITFQELKPGSMVSEGYLMELTDLGRHPVRSALQRLSWERMVEVHPRRGIIVPPISVEAQVKLLAVRRTVEELAVQWACLRATPTQRRTMSTLSTKLEEVTEAVDIIAFGGQLKHIHEIIVQAAHNEYLRLSIAPLQGLSRRFWFANIKDPEIELRRASSLHRSTLLAISTGDEQAATSASLALNDYLTEFTYRTLHTAVSS
ncbi:GntR family transcriptional regulator [Rhizobium sp. CNPSo 3968]|uniref:GntR family transcriptional regulator n=1 Tax=Rhizobium sp. CNPSo 3968 TaxID=3021408 RepID=UPI00254CD4EE|nr:GntR family transcriptional regulator [Rhizobium sp. CNPSo 3968]MDK4717911.1 GntR family transcriptional regulator [Rhizobium sp. CNPSo 3968]